MWRVDLALHIFGSLGKHPGCSCSGAGEMGEKGGRAFASRGAGNLTISSRKLEHAGRAPPRT